ncbi:MAG: SMC family ATPase, partial [Acidobacteriota bacterium]|nr:SMC family ATPase [Acidobacteriota bacterium]
MQLHRLKLVNFRQHAATEIDFGSGITAIIGPNGSGKTTLLEAMAWAFYGNPAARGSRDSIRWNRAPARASVRVEVEFSLGGHEFRVARGLYNAEFFQDRLDTPTVVGTQDVSRRVERLLGMTHDEFFSTYFTGQKELAVMASLGPTDRARFLSQVLGYERLRLSQDRVRETRSTLRGELTGLERGLADPAALAREVKDAEERQATAAAAVKSATETKERAARQLEQEGPSWTRMVELRESALKLEGELRVAERDVAEARRAFERLDKELAEALAAQSKLEALSSDLAVVEPLRTELEALELESRSAGQRRSLMGQQRELEEQAERVAGRAKSLADAARLLSEAKRHLTDARAAAKEAEAVAERARTTWVRDRQDAETKRQNLREQYLDHQKHRDSVVATGPDGECPICKRSLGDLYQEVLDTFGRQLEEIEVKGKFFKKRMEQLEREPAELRELETRAREAAAKVEQAVQEVARCEDRVREHKEVTAETERLAKRRAELERDIAALPDSYDAARHDTVRDQLKLLEPLVQQAAEFRVKATRAESLVSEAEAADRAASEREARAQAL